ncbi:MerR family transcriptional regulator [Lactococcus nasutitermitis]|uniref:MerR family transcriptional regulator n=1 Tax=Lactococcus nasutitermitis TaxID=1652957 RepID=A0ABV9JEX9_9LACT|nr:MerR family transcriptional regulator [Lactococcus nasutitermitis]
MVSIAQVVEKTRTSAYTLRYYEKEGLVTVPRNQAGVRVYDEAALRRVYAILHYRRAGIPLAKIKEILNTPDSDEFHLAILRERKAKLEEELAEMQETLDYLDYKIGVHEGRKPENISMEEWIEQWKGIAE